MARKLVKATQEMIAAVYELIGVPLPIEPLETLTVVFTEDHHVRLIETRMATVEVMPFVPKAPE